MVTCCAVVYVPGAGLKVGAAAAMVYRPLDTALLVRPEATAMALSVCVLLMVTGPTYFVLLLVGVAPLVV